MWDVLASKDKPAAAHDHHVPDDTTAEHLNVALASLLRTSTLGYNRLKMELIVPHIVPTVQTLLPKGP